MNGKMAEDFQNPYAAGIGSFGAGYGGMGMGTGGMVAPPPFAALTGFAQQMYDVGLNMGKLEKIYDEALEKNKDNKELKEVIEQTREAISTITDSLGITSRTNQETGKSEKKEKA
jgi:hypothetical protein